MQTKLPAAITTIEGAQTFLLELFNNGESFHPEDNAHNIIWSLPEEQKPTAKECDLLNKLMEDIYNVEGNNGNHANPVFDPCGYLLDLVNAN